MWNGPEANTTGPTGFTGKRFEIGNKGLCSQSSLKRLF